MAIQFSSKFYPVLFTVMSSAIKADHLCPFEGFPRTEKNCRMRKITDFVGRAFLVHTFHAQFFARPIPTILPEQN